MRIKFIVSVRAWVRLQDGLQNINRPSRLVNDEFVPTYVTISVTKVLTAVVPAGFTRF